MYKIARNGKNARILLLTRNQTQYECDCYRRCAIGTNYRVPTLDGAAMHDSLHGCRL